MTKIYQIDKGVMVFHCPGCECLHPFHVSGSPHKSIWGWNGSFDKPTFTPSLLVFASDGGAQCHSYVTDGRIMFLADCRHALAGKTVDIPDWEN